MAESDPLRAYGAGDYGTRTYADPVESEPEPDPEPEPEPEPEPTPKKGPNEKAVEQATKRALRQELRNYGLSRGIRFKYVGDDEEGS